MEIHDLIKDFKDTEIKMIRAKLKLEGAVRKHKAACKAVIRCSDASKGFKKVARNVMEQQ
jgi:hypothetical protein